MNKKIKISLVLIILILSLMFIYSFLLSFSKRSKANLSTISASFSQSNISVKQDQDLNIGFTLNAEDQKKISAVDLKFKFDSDDRDLLDYVSFVQTPDNYFNDELVKNVSKEDGAKVLNIVLTAKKPNDQLKDSVILNLKFRPKKSGETTISFMNSVSQVVGIAPENGFEFKNKDVYSDITILNPSGIRPLSIKTTLDLTLRFQGIKKQPLNLKNREMSVKLILAGTRLPQPIEKKVLFSSDENGLWHGLAEFSQVFPGPGYRVYIKGPKHLQKKICTLNPQETTMGGYYCSLGESFSLQGGKNKLDFSKIYMLAGDLPIQDGIVNSYDLSYIRNNLGNSDEKTLLIGDLNLDGIIDTQDYSLVVKSLSIRTDEE